MNIYFCGSIRGGRDDADLYGRLIKLLTSYGRVLTEHVGSDTMLATEKEITDKSIHDRDMDWLNSSDSISAMIRGAHNGSTFIFRNYKESEAADIFKELFERLKKSS